MSLLSTWVAPKIVPGIHRRYNPTGVNTVKAIYPGSFDPVTNGHLDLIARGAKIFDHLVVAILRNSHKDPLFTVDERIEMLTEGVAGLGHVSIATFDGLLVDFAREQKAQAVLRGIRAISDYEYELQMALMNRRLAPELETIFLMPDAKYSFVSSRLVKEVFELGGSVEGLVPPFVIGRLKQHVPHGIDKNKGKD
jgi:pantetheine-phosphate adenylyltransferase